MASYKTSTSPFLDLPLELRLEIYTHHFSQDVCQTTASSYYNLLRTCKTIHEEALPVAQEAYDTQMRPTKCISLDNRKRAYYRDLEIHPFRAIALDIDLFVDSKPPIPFVTFIMVEISKIAEILERKTTLKELLIRIPATENFLRLAEFRYALQGVKMVLERYHVQIYGEDKENVDKCVRKFSREQRYWMSEVETESDSPLLVRGPKPCYTGETEHVRTPFQGTKFCYYTPSRFRRVPKLPASMI